MTPTPPFASRAGFKLDHALNTFSLDVAGKICADLGSNVGGFVDVLLRRGAAKVYAVDQGYGQLAWTLRKDARVVVMERTNAMHVTLPEPADVVTIDVAWTKQRHILPAARRLVRDGGFVITLVKPHYESAAADVRGGVLAADKIPAVMARVKADAAAAGFEVAAETASPIKGGKGNAELLMHLRPKRTMNSERPSNELGNGLEESDGAPYRAGT